MSQKEDTYKKGSPKNPQNNQPTSVNKKEKLLLYQVIVESIKFNFKLAMIMPFCFASYTVDLICV